MPLSRCIRRRGNWHNPRTLATSSVTQDPVPCESRKEGPSQPSSKVVEASSRSSGGLVKRCRKKAHGRWCPPAQQTVHDRSARYASEWRTHKHGPTGARSFFPVNIEASNEGLPKSTTHCIGQSGIDGRVSRPPRVDKLWINAIFGMGQA